MVTQKDSKESELAHSQESVPSFWRRKPVKIVGVAAIGITSLIGVREIIQSPEDDAREALQEVIDDSMQNQEAPIVTTTTQPRTVVNDPDSPPATNIERPDVTVPDTQLELSPEEQLISELTPEFSEIVNANPSPYDIALKVEDFPDPEQSPETILEADMNSMSLILTHSYGRPEYINALFNNTPDNPYPNIDTLVSDATNIGRFRFPPEDDPEYSTDKPSFGVLYRTVLPEDEALSAFYLQNGQAIRIQTFGIERIHFNYDQEQEGWFLTADPYTQGNEVARTYTKQTVPLENSEGKTVITEVWQITSLDN